MGDLENLKAEAERLEKVLEAGVDRLVAEELGRVRSEIARIEGDPTSAPAPSSEPGASEGTTDPTQPPSAPETAISPVDPTTGAEPPAA